MKMGFKVGLLPRVMWTLGYGGRQASPGATNRPGLVRKKSSLSHA